jgi:hypothetical protein
MNASPEAAPQDPAAALEREVAEAIALCDGDMRSTIRALLVTMPHHEAQLKELRAAVSRGYTRGLLHPLLTAYGWKRGMVELDGEPE